MLVEFEELELRRKCGTLRIPHLPKQTGEQVNNPPRLA